MPDLSIPQRHRQPLVRLLTLDRPIFDALIARLEQYKPAVGKPLRLSSLATEPIESLERTDDVLAAINSLFVVWASASDQTAAAFSDDVLNAIASFNPEVATARRKDSKTRLQKILNIPRLALGAKALSVLTDHERQFHNAKVFTDVRYAFKPDPSVEPYGAGIVHSLKLTYHEGAEHKDFFVALDDEDLEQLATAVRRAQAKAKTLRQTIVNSRVEYLGK